MVRCMRLSIALICSLCFVLLMTMGATPPSLAPKPADAMPPLTIQGDPYTGELLGVRGFGFRSHEPVVIFLDGVAIGSTTARQAMGIINSDLGYIQTNVRIPDSTLNGNRILQAAGQTTGRVSMTTITVRSDWLQYGRTPAGTHNNASETTISTANVAQLAPYWTFMSVDADYNSIIAAHGKVYVTNNGTVTNVLTEVGNHPADGRGGSLDTAINDNTIIATGGGFIYYDLKTLAFVHSEDGGTSSPPAIADGFIYMTGMLPHSIQRDVLAYSATPCDSPNPCGPVWTFHLSDNSALEGTPAVANGVVYVGAENGSLYALDGQTGSLLWTGVYTGIERPASIAVADGYVFITAADLDTSTNSGALYAFSATGCGSATCSPLWASTGVTVEAGSVITNGSVFVVGRDSSVYAFPEGGCGSATCAPAWHAITTGSTVGGLTAANGVLYLATSTYNTNNTDSGVIYAFIASGCGTSACSPLWSQALSGAITAQPIVVNGILYVAARFHTATEIDPKLYTFHLPGGGVAQRQPTHAKATPKPITR
jgi:outer membrane protein assembly factor BamB